MDKPVKQHIVELERRIQLLNQEMLRNHTTRTQRNRLETELRVAQQALELYKEAIKLERHSQRN